MNESDANFSFDIRTPADLLKKLHEEYQEFLNNPVSSRHAVNCAVTAWHLIEWVWASHKQKMMTLSQSIKKEADFKQYISLRCPEIETMQAIANGTKHFKVDKRSGGSNVKAARIHRGGFSQEFSREFDISLLEIELADGSTLVFDDTIKTVVEFWDSFFQTHLL